MADAAPPVPLEELLAHREWVRRVALALTRDSNDADDIEQATWLAALRAPPTHRASLKGWLGTTIRRAAARLERSRARRHAGEAARPSSGAAEDIADLAARADLHRRVVEAVVALDEPCRGTLLLRFFEGLPVAEVAVRTGVPLETCRARLRRGIVRLRETFRDPDGRVRALLPLVAGGGGFEGRTGAASRASAPTAASGAALAGAAGGIAMGTKLCAAVVVVALAVGGAWWMLRPDAATERAAAPPTDARPAPGGESPADTPRARAAAPERAAPAPPPLLPPPLLPPPPPTDLPTRLESARLTIRWEGVGLEQGLATIVSETAADVFVPKSAIDRLRDVVIHLSLEDVSALAAVRTVCKLSGMAADVQADRIVVRPAGDAAADDGELVRIRRAEDLPRATVVFRVVDLAGAEVAGAEVLAEDGTLAFGTTDASGVLTVERTPPFPYVLARLPGRIDSPAVRTPADAGAPAEVKLFLGGPAARLRCSVRTADGRAVAGHWVTMHLDADGARLALRRHTFRTDAAGEFDDRSCPPGRIVLATRAEGYAYTEHALDVAAGDDLRAAVVLAHEAVCEGLVRDAAGNPAASVHVGASIGGRRAFASTTTDTSGRYRLGGLPAGAVAIEARDLRSRASARVEVDLAAGERRTVDADLAPEKPR